MASLATLVSKASSVRPAHRAGLASLEAMAPPASEVLQVSRVRLDPPAARVRKVSEDLSVEVDSREFEVVRELADSLETWGGLVSRELPVNGVSLETPAQLDLMDLLDFRD